MGYSYTDGTVIVTTLEAWEQAAEALHQFHPQMSAWPTGKGICTYRPCVLAREVKDALRKLDLPAREAELAANRARLEKENPA